MDSNPGKTDTYKRSHSNGGSYVVEYGPLRIRHRRTVSQTLATGRRSEKATLEGADLIKREARRLKNRLAARELKKTRDSIEFGLIETVKKLEEEKAFLLQQHNYLEQRKAQLNRAVYNAKQAPLVPLITDMDLPVLFGPQERQDLLIDLQPLLKSIDEHYTLSDC